MLKVTDVAKELNVTRQTIVNWIKSGYIKAVKIGTVYRIEEEEVERLKKGD